MLRQSLQTEVTGGIMSKNFVRGACWLGIAVSLSCIALAATPSSSDARLQKAYRFQQGGWTYVHLEGSPSDMGFQHGYLLAPEIDDAFEAIKLFDTHQTQRDWEFFRTTARQMLGRTSMPNISRNCKGSRTE